MSLPDMESNEVHPSFGMVGFFRAMSSGRGPLFQSHTENSTYVHLVIKQAEVQHGLGRDWVHGLETVVDVSMSAAQFAELLTTMNCGDGVPCTITQINGHAVPATPQRDSVASKVRSTFRRDVKERLQDITDLVTQVEAITTKQSALTKGDRAAIVAKMQEFVKLFSSTAPFMLDSFEEAVEKDVTAEADAFLTTIIHRAGLDHLASQAPTIAIDTLTEKDENLQP